MLYRRTIIFVLVFSLFFISCKKDFIDVSYFYQCNAAQQNDSVSVFNRLTGSWTWKEKSCSPVMQTVKADKTVIITFNSNSTFSLTESGTVIQGNWQLKRTHYNSWEIDMTPLLPYTFGDILFCGNQVVFNASNRDGCDHMFEK